MEMNPLRSRPGSGNWPSSARPGTDAVLSLLRGVFGNYLHQGADGVGIFNNPAGSAEHARRLGLAPQANYDPEIGSLATIAGKPRYCALDRRGGYAHTEGYGSSNSNAPLPITLRYDGTVFTLTLPVWEPVKSGTAASLRLVRVPVESLKRGPNTLAISVNRTGPFPASRPVYVEKVELHLKGKPSA